MWVSGEARVKQARNKISGYVLKHFVIYSYILYLATYSSFRTFSIQRLYENSFCALVVEPFTGIVEELQFVFQKVLIMARLKFDVAKCVRVSEEVLPGCVFFHDGSKRIEATDI